MSVRERIRKIKHLQHRFFVCVLENPSDIKNIGTVIRNVSAFGVPKLYIVSKEKIDMDFESSRTNKKLTSVSVGANKWVFVKYFKTTHECLEHLKKNNYTIAVTSSHIQNKENINLYDSDYNFKRLAVWFGNETHGISKEALEKSDFCIQIPMGGIVESLNLGTSTGIVLSYISYHRLRYVFEHNKVRSRPKGLRKLKLKSWKDFINQDH